MRSQSGNPTTQERHRDDEIEGALRRPGEPGQDRRPQLEERDSLARDVLTLVDQELGRRGCELHLDPEAMGEMDDLEHVALVEVGLGENELSRSLPLEQGGEVGELVPENPHARDLGP